MRLKLSPSLSRLTGFMKMMKNIGSNDQGQVAKGEGHEYDFLSPIDVAKEEAEQNHEALS